MPDLSTSVAPFRGRMVLCSHVSGLGEKRDLRLFVRQVGDFRISVVTPDIMWISGYHCTQQPRAGSSNLSGSVVWISGIPGMNWPVCQASVTRCLGWTWILWKILFLILTSFWEAILSQIFNRDMAFWPSQPSQKTFVNSTISLQ